MSDDESVLDPEVSAMYRASANERAPESLDAKVLAAASVASRWQGRTWLIPAALAAALVLGLGLGLRLTDVRHDAAGPLLPDPIAIDAATGALDNSAGGPCAGRREPPNEWRLCISELRQAGDAVAASSEEAALIETLPPDVAGR